MKVTARLKNLRIAPRKARLTAVFIKGMDVNMALSQLDAKVKKTNPYMRKLILSAVANGENNYGLDKDNLYVCDVRVGAGPTMKRWMPKAFGRAGKILKRTSNIDVVLEERVEGKGRKSKEEMEKEKKKRLEDKKREEKQRLREEKEREESKETAQKIEDKKNEDFGKKEGKKGNWAKRIFQRKSM